MQNIPTVTIRRDDMDVRINLADYDRERDGDILASDPGVDVAALNQPEAPPQDQTPVETPPAVPPVTEAGQEPPVPAMNAAEDRAPVEAPVTAQEPPARAVVKRGRKFFVTDATGKDVVAEGIDATGYTSESDAWDAVLKAGQ